MAERHWVGATSGLWNNAANWSATQGGAGGAGVPTTGDDVYIDKALTTTTQFINTNQDIGAINSLRFPDVSATAFVSTQVAGTTSTASGTTWTVPSSVSIIVGPGTGVGGVLNVATVGGTFVKTGTGLLYRTTATSTWGATNIDLQEGSLGANAVNNSLGSGTITMSAGTGVDNANMTTGYSIQNPIVVNGAVFLNRRLDPTTQALAALTLTGTVSLGASNRTITHSGTGANNNAAILTGAISGTAGITIDSATTGTGYLQATDASSGLSGGVTVNNTATLWLGSYTTSGLIWENAGTINVNATGATLQWSSNAAFTIANPLTGTGNFLFSNSAASPGTTLPTLVNITNSSATVGCGPYVANSQNTTITVSDFAPKMGWQFDTANTGTLRFVRSGSGLYTTSSNFVITSILAGFADIDSSQNTSTNQRLEIAGNISQTRASGTALQTLRFVGGNYDNSGEQVVSGNILRPTNSATNALAVTITSGKWKFSGANDFLGALTVPNATTSTADCYLVAASGGATTGALGGSTSTATFALGDNTAGNSAAATLEITGGVDINIASRPFTYRGYIRNTSGDNTLRTGTITVGTFAAGSIATTNAYVAPGTKLTLTGLIGTGSNAPLYVNGGGTLALTNTASTFTGGVQVTGSTLEVTRLASSGVASSIGASTGAFPGPLRMIPTSGNPVVIRHVGTSADTGGPDSIISVDATGNDKVIEFDSSGVGGSMYMSIFTWTTSGSGTWTMKFSGTNTGGDNSFNTFIPSTGTAVLQVVKEGTNTWLLDSSSVSSTGSFTVNGGTLKFSSSVTLAGGLYINNGSTASLLTATTLALTTSVEMEDGTLNATIAGAGKTLTVTSNATDLAPASLNPQNATTGSNTFTGNATINGTVDLVTKDGVTVSTATYGRVLGASNTVTVSSTGTIRTKTSATSNQRGQARYNNLTLQSGSKMKIGLAA